MTDLSERERAVFTDLAEYLLRGDPCDVHYVIGAAIIGWLRHCPPAESAPAPAAAATATLVCGAPFPDTDKSCVLPRGHPGAHSFAAAPATPPAPDDELLILKLMGMADSAGGDDAVIFNEAAARIQALSRAASDGFARGVEAAAGCAEYWQGLKGLEIAKRIRKLSPPSSDPPQRESRFARFTEDELEAMHGSMNGERDGKLYPVYEALKAEIRGAARESASDPLPEYGWVIERSYSEPSAPEYWCANLNQSAWTKDHMEAVRFARYRDAEVVRDTLMSGAMHRICEHIWTDVRDSRPFHKRAEIARRAPREGK